MDSVAFIDLVAEVINILGVLAIISGIIVAIFVFLAKVLSNNGIEVTYRGLRQNLGRTIIIGLELLIAGDIVRSIAVPPTFTTVGVLAIIVLIRAFLSVQIEKGTDWRLPWSVKS